MIQLKQLVEYCNELLSCHSFRDYAPNGLQVEGRSEVRKIVTGVTANQALIDAAVSNNADAVIVHHGFFWKNESPCITGIKYRRLSALIKNGVSLLGYHLPLDAHPDLGNNAQLAKLLDIVVDGRFGQSPGDELAMYGHFNEALTVRQLSRLIEEKLERKPLHLKGSDGLIKRVAWCTGAAQGYIAQAAERGVHAYISGEVSESTAHFSRESGVHYFAAGHHATERYGVEALGLHLRERFALDVVFVDIDNPV